MAETATAYDVSDAFLRALGAPTTPAMRRAVAIWLRFESGGTIVGNNPWNLHSGAPCKSASKYCPGVGTLPGQIGNRYAGPGDQNVAVFATLDDGARASANNLVRLAPAYGYADVIRAARAGNAIGFLDALQKSSWSAGHYNYSKLTGAFGGSFNYNTSLTLRQPSGASGISSIGTASSINATPADVWTYLGKKPTDVLTEADYAKLIEGYKGVGFSDPEKIIGPFLRPFIGKPLNTIPTQFTIDSHHPPVKLVPNSAQQWLLDNTPVGDIVDVASLAAGVGAFLFDVDNWKYIAALALGVPMTLLGFYLLAGVPTGGRNA